MTRRGGTVLETIRELLGHQPHLTGEWSLRLAGGKARVREHALFWVGARQDHRNAEAFSRVGVLLEHLGAPAALRAVQATLAPTSVRQGVSVAVLEPGHSALRLYVHHHPPGETAECYDAYEGRSHGPVEHARYDFTRSNSAAQARAMGASVHPALRGLLARLLDDSRIVTLSGMWIRRRGGVPDQLCVTYPWHPPAHAVVGLAERLGDVLPMQVRPMHLRHVALAGVAEPRPHVTLYFSAPLTAERWPRSHEELRARVAESAAVLHAGILSLIATRQEPGDV